MISPTRTDAGGFEAIAIVDGMHIFPIFGHEDPPAAGDQGDAGQGDDGAGNGEPDPSTLDEDGNPLDPKVLEERSKTDAARQEAIAHRKALRAWQRVAKAAGLDSPEALAERLSGATKDGDGNVVDLDKVRREAASEAVAGMRRTLVSAQVKALAAEKFADPTDAVLHLAASGDLDDYEVDATTGDLEDPQDVVTALENLLRSKPHLSKVRKPERDGDYDGGARNTPPGAAQDMSSLVRSQLRGMRGGRR